MLPFCASTVLVFCVSISNLCINEKSVTVCSPLLLVVFQQCLYLAFALPPCKFSFAISQCFVGLSSIELCICRFMIGLTFENLWWLSLFLFWFVHFCPGSHHHCIFGVVVITIAQLHSP